jgi:hypothetical protein
MPVTMTNRGKQLLILQLNDGQAVYLAPGETSRPLQDMQVSGNDKVAKLTRESLVSVAPVTPARKRASAAAATEEATEAAAEAEEAEPEGASRRGSRDRAKDRSRPS